MVRGNQKDHKHIHNVVYICRQCHSSPLQAQGDITWVVVQHRTLNIQQVYVIVMCLVCWTRTQGISLCTWRGNRRRYYYFNEFQNVQFCTIVDALYDAHCLCRSFTAWTRIYRCLSVYLFIYCLSSSQHSHISIYFFRQWVYKNLLRRIYMPTHPDFRTFPNSNLGFS